MKRLFIIPAKGRSTRIHQKNIRNFCGQPIIKRVLSTILKVTKPNDTIHVSTDDDLVIQLCAEMSLKPEFSRPDSLCKDDTTLLEVRSYVLEKYNELGYNFGTIIQVLPTSVLLIPDVLTKAIKLVECDRKVDVLLSICPFSTPIQWAYALNNDYSLTPREETCLQTPSQNLKTFYHETGDFVIYKSASIARREVNHRINGYLLPYTSVDIDTMDDWYMAEKLFNGGLHG